MCKAALAQYALAGVALICAVVVNVFGRESEGINTMLVSVISSALWGGYQRQLGSHQTPTMESDEKKTPA